MEATQGKVRRSRYCGLRARYTASLRVLLRALKDVRQEWSPDLPTMDQHRRIYRPWISAPDVVLLVDWGEVGRPACDRKLLCFCAVLWAGAAGSTYALNRTATPAVQQQHDPHLPKRRPDGMQIEG